MLQAPSIMEIDAAAPSLGAAQTGADKKSDTVEEYQIADLWTMASKLYADAAAVEDQAKRMLAEAGPDAADEAEHAKRQAQAMRSTAEQVSMELNAAPKDKSGRIKISATRVASLYSSVEHVMAYGEKEKGMMTEVTTEAKSLNNYRAEAIAEKPKPTFFGTIRKVCGLPEHSAATTLAASAASHTWRDQVRNAITDTQLQASQSFHRVWQSTSNTISNTVNAARHYGGIAAAGVTTFVTHPVDTTMALYNSAVESTTDLMEATAEQTKIIAKHTADMVDKLREKTILARAAAQKAYDSAQKTVAEHYASVKAGAARVIASLNPFSRDEKPTAVAKAMSPVSAPNRAKALVEAMAISLPLCLAGQTGVHTSTIVMPSCPSVGLDMDAFSHLF